VAYQSGIPSGNNDGIFRDSPHIAMGEEDLGGRKESVAYQSASITDDDDVIFWGSPNVRRDGRGGPRAGRRRRQIGVL
jgi:hypothetical protein